MVITFLLWIISLKIRSTQNILTQQLDLKYKGTFDDELVFENKDEFSEAWIQIIGQVIVVMEDGTIVKTYIVDGIYEESVFVQNSKEIKIKRLECPLANSSMEKFEKELEQLLGERGYDKNVMVVKEIGLVAISTRQYGTGTWTPHYCILDDNSLLFLDEDVAEAKMSGVELTEENWGDTEEQEKILAELKECALAELEEKDRIE